MKKYILTLATGALLLVSVPAQAMASVPKEPATVPAEVVVLLSRLDEIAAMDRSSLSRADKKELRAEVREIKNELKRLDSTVTISVGAILLIILIILLI